MRKILSLALALVMGLVSEALAQSSPSFTTGQVPTAANWNSYFAAKQDLNGTLTSIAGGTVNAAPGTYGDATHCVTAIVNTAGLVTSLSQVSCAGGGGLPTSHTTAPQLNGTYLTTAKNYLAYGDSVTAGSCCTIGQYQAYPYLIANDMGTVIVDAATGGDMACDNQSSFGKVFGSSSGYQTAPSTTSQTLYTIMYGINDANTKGAGAYEVNYNFCQAANVSWLATPLTSKVLGQAATAAGTWINDTAPVSGYGIRSTTNGSTLTFPITTTGGPIYIWSAVYDGKGGSFTYSIDGGAAVTVNGFTATAIATMNGSTSAMILTRTAAPAAGSHTVVITVTSTTNANNIVDIWAIGTPPNLITAAEQTTIVGGVIIQGGNTAAAATLAYNNDAAAIATMLSGDGLPVRFADVRKYVTLADMGANTSLHPNALGHVHLHDAFEAVAQPVIDQGQYAIYGNINSKYRLANPYNNLSGTDLNGGFLWLNNSPYTFGVDLGKDAVTGQFATRMFCATPGCEHMFGGGGGGLSSGNQAGYSPDFIVSSNGLSTRGTSPTVSGTGTPTIASGSTDTQGEVTAGASATSIVITFAAGKTNPPFCVPTSQNGNALTYSTTTSALSITQVATSGNKIDYFCMQR